MHIIQLESMNMQYDYMLLIIVCFMFNFSFESPCILSMGGISTFSHICGYSCLVSFMLSMVAVMLCCRCIVSAVLRLWCFGRC